MFATRTALQSLPSRAILQNLQKRSLTFPHHPTTATTTTTKSFSTTPNARLPRAVIRKKFQRSARLLTLPPRTQKLMTTSFSLGGLYSLAWLLEIPPHKFVPDLLFDAEDDVHTLLDEETLAAVRIPEGFDVGNDHFFDTLFRARPLKYGVHLKKAQREIERCRVRLRALESVFSPLQPEAASPRERERRESVAGEVEMVKELLGEAKRRWVRLFILDLREGSWRTMPGCRERTVERVVREWLGWDVENLVGEFVRMGFIDVRED